jgi:1,5-anhydro-D-fructose reductase (1,5-anhydro-D-mannitol-forming)
MLKVGIIGYGKMGKIRHEATHQDGRGKVVGFFEPNFRGTVPDGLKSFSSAEALIASPEIDTLFVCTPNFLNKKLTIAGLESGKHVFCEKPPAFTAKDVEEIRRAEEKSGKTLMYGFNHRQHASILKAKEMVDSGQFGKVLWMRGRYGKSVDQDFYQTWRAKKELAGGGILIDQGIHMLDLFLMFAEDFDEVQAMVSNLYWKLEVEDNVFAMLRNSKTGVVASLHSTMSQWRHLFSLEIFLEKGHITINGLMTPSRTYGDEVLNYAKNRSKAPAATWSDLETMTFPVDTSWTSETKIFFDAILERRPVPVGNSTDALKLMKIIDKIYSYGVR